MGEEGGGWERRVVGGQEGDGWGRRVVGGGGKMFCGVGEGVVVGRCWVEWGMRVVWVGWGGQWWVGQGG